MYDFQKTVLVEAKPSTKNLVGRYALLAFTLLSLAGLVLFNPFLFFMPTILLGLACFALWKHSGVEYEYFYFDGEMTFDRIRDKRRRKALKRVKMQDVLEITLATDPSLYNVQKDNTVKKLDYSSGMEGNTVYVMIVNQSGVKFCISFEPDEDMLSSIRMKFPAKIKR